ncbi:mpv17-like protein 2 [Pieris brassicae]|uniref:mpv17-like protein 2 n=1 Tax=Pieris brassicae TaxID=7116 RepID=UPI001E6608C8|nr:mpv17-like protein 2 [Pieris brassicae]
MPLRRLMYNGMKAYKLALKKAFTAKNLFYTNVIISICLSTTGDFLEQNFELYVKEIEKYDYRRSVQMAVSGMTTGIICHNWYIFLDKVIIGRTFQMVIKKLLLDQFICSPIVIMSFFATVAIFEDNPLGSFTDEVGEKFWILYKAEWYVWPPAQIINFYFLPTRYRVLYDNTISLGYDVYTSHIKHYKSKKHSKEDSNDKIDR